MVIWDPCSQRGCPWCSRGRRLGRSRCVCRRPTSKTPIGGLIRSTYRYSGTGRYASKSLSAISRRSHWKIGSSSAANPSRWADCLDARDEPPMSALCQKQTSPPPLLVLTEKESHRRGRGWESRSSRRLHCSLRHAFQPTQDSVAVTLIGHKRSSRNARLTHRFDPLSPRRSWLERIAKVLGLAGYLPIFELHYAHRIRPLPIVSKDKFSDP